MGFFLLNFSTYITGLLLTYVLFQICTRTTAHSTAPRCSEFYAHHQGFWIKSIIAVSML